MPVKKSFLANVNGRMVRVNHLSPPEIRFWAYVDKKGRQHPTLGRCWKWTGTKNGGGYGDIHVHKRAWLAHRYSWVLNVGEIPEDQNVLHSCDNPECTNPVHLFLGNDQVNTADRDTKGRQARGERIGQAKLTEEDVRDIRKRYVFGSKTNGLKSLAKEFGVSWGTIWSVITCKTWKHII